RRLKFSPSCLLLPRARSNPASRRPTRKHKPSRTKPSCGASLTTFFHADGTKPSTRSTLATAAFTTAASFSVWIRPSPKEKAGAPDLRMTADQMSVQGNIVTVQWTAQGTHTGRGNGLMKPTGKRIFMHGSSRFRVVNGKIAEVWNEYDCDEIFRQLGVNPTVGH